MFAEAIEAILRDQCTPPACAPSRPAAPPPRCGKPWPEPASSNCCAGNRRRRGSAAGAMFPIFVHFGRCAVPVPVAQTIAARALLGPGTTLPDGLLTLAPALRAEATASCAARRALRCDCAIRAGRRRRSTAAARMRRRAAHCPPACAHSQLATLVWPDERSAERWRATPPRWRPWLRRCMPAMLAGAMKRVFDMTLQYCNDRAQFGKSIGKFQAVQHQLSVMAEQVAAAAMAAELAFQSTDRTPRCCRCDRQGAHQRGGAARGHHGPCAARRHRRHRGIRPAALTRRLHEWRMAHGSESYWNRLIGEQVLAASSTLVEFVRAA